VLGAVQLLFPVVAAGFELLQPPLVGAGEVFLDFDDIRQLSADGCGGFNSVYFFAYLVPVGDNIFRIRGDDAFVNGLESRVREAEALLRFFTFGDVT
jgi:hypothetical protein